MELLPETLPEKRDFIRNPAFLQVIYRLEQPIAHALKSNVQFAKKQSSSFGIM